MKEDAFRCGVVALLGRPNTGKSTLMNRLIGQKIAITSHKPQTTRARIRTIYTDDEAQIIFLDTPGIHIAKNKLGKYMVHVARSALKDIDAVLLMTEPEGKTDEAEDDLIRRLSGVGVPVIIVLNKTDLFPEETVAQAADRYHAKMPAARIIGVSALKGTGTETLLAEIKSFLPYGEALYDEDEITDEPVRDIAAEIIREKALRLLWDEVPHGIAVQIEKMREQQTVSGEPFTEIEAVLICEKESHKGIVIGKGGKMLKKIGQTAREDIEKLTEGKVNLRLFVKVRKDWRDNETQLRSLGYRA